MKHTTRTLTGILASMLLLGTVGCGKQQNDARQTSDMQKADTTISERVLESTSNTQAAPIADVRVLSDLPAEYRPEVSDPAAVAAHGVKVSAVYNIPNGVVLTMETTDGAKRVELNLSSVIRIEQYTDGAWSAIDGHDEESGKIGKASLLSPYQYRLAFQQFPEPGVYRCAVLCEKGGITAEHYAYFEVPEYTMTVPTEADRPAANTEDAPLSVTAEDVSPDGLTLVIKTKPPIERYGVSYGDGFRIFCHVNGKWEKVTMYTEEFKAIARVSEIAGELRMDINLTGRLHLVQPGHYRIEKTLENVTYYAYFEIADVEETPGDVWLVPSEADRPAASREDTPLYMTVEDVSPTQATLVLRAKDGSVFGVGYGLAYGIQRFEEEGWVGVGPLGPFAEPYYETSARPEHRDTVKLEADGAPLTPGYYRLSKDFSTTVNGERVDVTYYAYFEIGE